MYMFTYMHQEEMFGNFCQPNYENPSKSLGISQNHGEFPSAFRIEPDEDPLQMFAYLLSCEKCSSPDETAGKSLCFMVLLPT